MQTTEGNPGPVNEENEGLPLERAHRQLVLTRICNSPYAGRFTEIKAHPPKASTTTRLMECRFDKHRCIVLKHYDMSAINGHPQNGIYIPKKRNGKKSARSASSGFGAINFFAEVIRMIFRCLFGRLSTRAATPVRFRENRGTPPM